MKQQRSSFHRDNDMPPLDPSLDFDDDGGIAKRVYHWVTEARNHDTWEGHLSRIASATARGVINLPHQRVVPR